jgi:hypothetical protein
LVISHLHDLNKIILAQQNPVALFAESGQSWFLHPQRQRDSGGVDFNPGMGDA